MKETVKKNNQDIKIDKKEDHRKLNVDEGNKINTEKTQQNTQEILKDNNKIVENSYAKQVEKYKREEKWTDNTYNEKKIIKEDKLDHKLIARGMNEKFKNKLSELIMKFINDPNDCKKFY